MKTKIRISKTQLNRFLLKKQNLDAINDVYLPILVERLCGLHATIATTPYLSLFSRLPDFKKYDLDLALYEDKSLLRMRSVRKTMYIYPISLVPAMYQATYCKSLKDVSKQMENQGISVGDYERIADRIMFALKEMPMSANELKRFMGAPQPLSGLLNRMCELGILARTRPTGSWKSQAYQYALFDSHLPEVDLNSVSEEEARKIVVKAYLAAFGPAKLEDIAWWTDFGKSKVKSALNQMKEEIMKVDVTGLDGEFLMLFKDLAELGSTAVSDGTVINFLPTLDPYLMAYKDRRRILDDDHYDFIYDRSGNAAASILLNGEIIGVWDMIGEDELLVKVYIFKMIDETTCGWIYQMAERTGTFIADRSAAVRRVRDMVPLNKQGVGKVWSPLRDMS